MADPLPAVPAAELVPPPLLQAAASVAVAAASTAAAIGLFIESSFRFLARKPLVTIATTRPGVTRALRDERDMYY
jgi:hypothetical protein